MDDLARLAEAAHERFGDYRSLWFEGAWHDSGTLHDRGTRVAGGLRAMGVRPGDRVVVYMANCPEVTITYHALWRAGAVVTPVIFLATAPELRHAVADSRAVAVVTTAELAPRVLAAVEGLAVHVVVAGGTAGASTVDYRDLESAEPLSPVGRDADDLAALLYTGGTTGRSKGVPLSHRNLVSAGRSSYLTSYVPGLERGIVALPLAHSFGLLVTVGSLHRPAGPVTVLQRWFDPVAWPRLVAEHRVEVAAAVPSMLSMLLAQPLEEYDLSSLAYVYSGAAPLPAAVAAQFERRVPSVSVLEGYGCTETAGLISSTPPARRRPGTVGVPVPGIELRIVDLDGRDLPAGEDGEIVVRGPNVMAGYWRSGEGLTDGGLDEGGWFPTGDIGHLDAEGYLTIVDRKKDLIIRGGYNVYPRDVEDVLAQHPDVVGSGVVGRVDERLGEEVVAYVALRPGATATAEDLIAFARERLAATKYPREVHLVETIPLTSVGKVDRKRLRSATLEGGTPY